MATGVEVAAASRPASGIVMAVNPKAHIDARDSTVERLAELASRWSRAL